jgi:hypothetical protein
MPKKIHDKVDDLLNSLSFYPEKSDKEREELAWPIATNIVKESSFNLKRFTYAQAGDEILKSSSIKDFATKFQQFTTRYPGFTSEKAFQLYISLNPQYFGKKLSGYPAFRFLATKFKEQPKIFTSDEIEQALLVINGADASNFSYNEELTKESPAADTSSAPTADITKQPQGITGETVIQNVPGAKNIPGNSGATGIQNIIQYNSQSAARAPKNEAQIAASERMFMMDNMDALNILSRNIYDVNALRNFEKDLTFSKNHYGTRFEAPVTNMMNLYGSIINEKDPKVRNKLGAQIQSIIQNQLLGSGVNPSVAFDKINPVTRTEYLYSGKQTPTPYQFRYLEDVYNEKKAQMETEFETARKAFRDKYLTGLIEKNPDTPAERLKFDTLDESLYPDNLKKVAGPGSPIHKREWMEANKKSIMQELTNQPTKDSSLKTTKGPAIDEPVGESNKTGTTPPDTTKSPTTPAPPTGSAPPSGGAQKAANRIKKFNLSKHS